MKRALAFTLMVLAIMIIAVSCDEPHVHSFSNKWESNEDYHWHKAICEHTDEVGDKAEHVWKEGGDDNGWITEKAATETEKGSAYRICTICGYKGTKDIQKLSHVHTYSSYGRDDNKHWRTCTSCGEKFTYTHTFSYVDAGTSGHYKKCGCGYSELEKHVYTDKKVLKSENIYKVCDICGNSDTQATNASDSSTVVAGKEADLSGKSSKNDYITVEENGKNVTKKVKVITTQVEIEVAATAETGATTNNKTIVSFPSEALKVDKDATSVSLVVEAADISAASAKNSDYQITSSSSSNTGAVVAGFEFNLSGAVASDLTGKDSDGNVAGVTVKTYIAPNLTTANIDEYSKSNTLKIVYVDGDDETAKITKYNTGTGYLEFTVYHFSRYAIVAENFVAVGDNKKMYTLNSLVKQNGEANANGETKGYTLVSEQDLKKITLLKDIEVDDYILVNSNIEIDGNNHTLKIGNENIDNRASGLYIAGNGITVSVKNIKLVAGSEYKKDNALVYVHHANKNPNATNLTLENVVMECNPDGKFEVIPSGVMTTHNITGKIIVKDCTINDALHGMYFNSIKTGNIEGNTINGTRKSGINIADVSGTKDNQSVIDVKDNTLTEISSLNDDNVTENCGIYVGDIPSTVTLGTNDVSLATTCTNGAEIIYSKENITTAEELKTFLSSEDTGTAYLNKAIELTENIGSKGKKILNLCGKTLKTSKNITNKENGNLTIKNGTVKFEMTPTTSMHAFDNKKSATFTASGLTLDITFKNSSSNTGDLIGFNNVGTAKISNESKISVKCEEATQNGGAGESKVTGVMSGNNITIDNSTIEVNSASEASSYGFYMYLSEDSEKSIIGTLSDSTVEVTQTAIGSVSPVFAESYNETYKSIINITKCKKISGNNTIGTNKADEKEQKYVYAVRAKGNGVINIDSSSAANTVCKVTSTDTAGAKNILEKEKLTIGSSEVEGQINTNYSET